MSEREEKYTLAEGEIVLTWPDIDATEIEDVAAWLNLVIRKMKRSTVSVPSVTTTHTTR